MKRVYAIFFLAFVLVLGQHAGLLHALGHATEQLTQKPGAPAKVACDQCFACSQLSGGTPSMPTVQEPPREPESHSILQHVAASLAATVVFRSRAPPVLS